MRGPKLRITSPFLRTTTELWHQTSSSSHSTVVFASLGGQDVLLLSFYATSMLEMMRTSPHVGRTAASRPLTTDSPPLARWHNSYPAAH